MIRVKSLCRVIAIRSESLYILIGCSVAYSLECVDEYLYRISHNFRISGFALHVYTIVESLLCE